MGLVSFKKLTLATYRGQKAKGQRVKGEAEEIVGVPQKSRKGEAVRLQHTLGHGA